MPKHSKKGNSDDSSNHHKKHKHDEEKQFTFTHMFAFKTLDPTFLVNNLPVAFDIKITVKVNNDLVSLILPFFSFTLPTRGFLFNLPETNLPKHYWHDLAMPYTFELESAEPNQKYVLYIFNDGSIVIGAPAFQPLSAGQHNTYSSTATYLSNEPQCKIPKNFKLFDKNSNITKIVKQTNDFLDYYNNDFYEEVIAYTFSGNPDDDITNTQNVNLYATIGKLENNCIRLDKAVLLFQPDNKPLGQRCLENTISINPTDKKNMVVTAQYRNQNVPVGDPSFDRFRVIRSYTFDGGKTWTTGFITGSDTLYGLPPIRSDPSGLFDSYGNYWLCYMVAGTSDYQAPFELVFAVSTDKGVNFTIVGTTTLNSYVDYPRLYFGGDGHGGKALWFSVDIVNNDTSYVDNVVVGYIQVSGFGKYKKLTYDVAKGIGKDIATDSIAFIQVPEILATPEGDVYLFGPTQIADGDSGNYGQSVIYRHTGGIDNFDFVGPKNVLMTNVGGNDFSTAAFGKAVPFQPNRGIYPNGARGIDYDPFTKRIWISSNNIKPNVFDPVVDLNAKYNMEIFAMYSDNGGNSWSNEIQIRDTDKRNAGLPSIKVNQKTGQKAFFWYDGRDGKIDNGQSVKPFGAILD